MSSPTPSPTPSPSALARIVIPLDGSPLSDSALRIGFAIADRVGAPPVTLLHVADSTDRTDTERHLEHVRRRFVDVAPCETSVLAGNAADVIIDHARAPGTLVCMASHGRSGLALVALGSVAEQVIRRSTSGTLVVGPRCGPFALAREHTAALFCTDGSERSAAAGPQAARLATLLDLDTTIVQHVEPDEDVAVDGGDPPRPILDAARANCAELQRFFEKGGIRADSRVVFGETSRAICDVAASSAATVIALASHGRTGLGRFVLGSTAAHLVQRAPCPLFVVGPAAAEPVSTEPVEASV